MGLFVNTNVASLNAQRNLLDSSRKLSTSYQRLSSGLRINSAKDDAAGLAISTRFTSQIRGLTQAVRNTNDGISMAQTVEGALQESTNILQRIRQLAVQAANDINTTADREALNEEVDQLVAELNRIGDTTRFNDQNVLNGDFVQNFFHVGANAFEQIGVTVKDARASALGRAAITTSDEVTAEAFDKAANSLLVNGVTVRTTVAVDDTVSTTLNAASAIAKAQAINDVRDITGVGARVLATVDDANDDITAGVLDEDDYIQINGQIITGFEVQADDADGELVAQINAVSDETGVVATLDADYRLVLTAVDGRNIDVVTENNGAVIAGLDEEVTLGRIEFSSADQFFVNEVGAGLARVGFGNPQLVGVNSVNSVDTVTVLDREQANRTIEVVDRALAQISRDRSRLGALQNRLESTINNLTTVTENLSASRSRILDADFASTSADLARNQILQQAGTTILAQANQATQAALTLLQ